MLEKKSIKKVIIIFWIITLLVQYIPNVLSLTKDDQTVMLQSIILHEGGPEASGTLTDEQLAFYDENIYGYTIGNTRILKIVEENNYYADSLYCLNATKSFPGITSSGQTSLQYTNVGDFNSSTNTEIQGLHLSTSYANNSSLWNTNYSALKRLFSNLYLKTQTPEQKDTFLEKAFEGYTTYDLDAVKAYLTDDDIDVVQQYAIWYFTNRDTSAYNVTTLPAITLTDIYNTEDSIDAIRKDMANYLYKYLITTAASGTTETVTYPSIASTNVEVTKEGDYFVAGPFKVNSGSMDSSEYTIKLLDGSKNEISRTKYNILIEGETSFTNQNIKNIINKNYYIYLPKENNTIRTINLELSYSKYETSATVWKNKTTNDQGVEVYQPVLLLNRSKVNQKLNKSVDIPELIKITVTKQWNDNNNQDGLRAEYEVTLTGTVDGTVVYTNTQTLGATTTTSIWSDLDKYKNGKEIVYTVDETKVPTGYTKSVDGYTITNTHTPGKTSVTVNKIWDDSNNQDGLRAEYEVTLTGMVDGAVVYTDTQTLSATTTTYTWNNLDKYKNGKEIVYTVDETKVPTGYTKSVDGYTITNKHTPTTPEPEKTSVTVNKIWNDNNNQDGLRDTYDVVLIGTVNGTEVYRDTKVLKASELTYTWSNLDKYRDGEEIVYTVDESRVPTGYTKSVNGYTITNTHTPTTPEPEKTSVTVNKIWNDNNNQDGLRDTYDVVLIGTVNGTEVYRDTKVLKASELTYTWSNLDKYRDGEEIVYTVDESRVPTGYTKSVNGYTITNTHTPTTPEPEKTSVTVNKIWNDNNNQDGLRDTYEVVLIGTVNGTEVYRDTKVLKASELTYTWSNLDKYKDGEEIVYTVDESRVPTGYTKSVDGYTITNTHIVKEFDLSLKKFITKVNNEELEESREPVVDVTPLKEGTSTDANYTKITTPLEVNPGDLVTYKIRVYNEGNTSGYAQEIADYIPEGLGYLEGYKSNVNNGWEVEEGNTSIKLSDIQKGTKNLSINDFNGISDLSEVKVIAGKSKIKTNKLSSENEENLIRAFDKNEGTTLDYKEVEITCIVLGDELKYNNFKNIAEITDDRDEEGKEIEDIDSTPDTVNPENYPDGEKRDDGTFQDDNDYEDLIVKHKEFDLSLQKFITGLNSEKVTGREPTVQISDNNEITFISNVSPLEVENNDLITYTIRVYNEGDIAGYAKEVADDLPKGIEFVIENETNKKYGWKLYDENGEETTDLSKAKTVRTNYLSKEESEKRGEDCLIKAFDKETKTLDYVDLEIVFKVVENDIDKETRRVRNIAEITDDEDKDGDDVEDTDSTPGNGDEKEDDIDDEEIYVKYFDLSLQKFITKVDSEKVTGREPTVQISDNNEITFVSNVSPLEVETNDLITYTIRVYNEGEIAGYAKEVADDLPKGIEFVIENETNKKYGWKLYDENGEETTDLSKAKTVRTNYLSKEESEKRGEDCLIKAFDKETKTLDYVDLEIVFKVVENDIDKETRRVKNIAEITDDEDKDGDDVEDTDSTPGNGDEKEDDIDDEEIYVKYFDLSLQKFITGLNSEKVTGREPTVQISDDNEITFESNVSPLEVENNDLITYTIRVYNEGEMAGYAKEVSDNLPEGLEFVIENETNKKYGWKLYDENGEETTDLSKAKTVRTNYLSKEASEERGEDCLIKAFNKETKTLDYVDLEIVFKVVENDIDKETRRVKNIAEITDDEDKDGDDVEDTDSTPGNGDEKEDDIDDEEIYVKYFDLSLQKDLVKIIITENGTTREIDVSSASDLQTVKVHSSLIDSTIVKFVYKITVKNEGEIAGYATEIKDYIPEGLKFVESDNPNWSKESDSEIITTALSEIRLEPNDTASIEVVLQWENSSNNFGTKINVAEISKDKNDSDTPDRDSTPNNKVDGEDDMDDAPVKLETIVDPTPETPTQTTPQASVPKTGDLVPVIAISVIAIVILANIIYSVYTRRKKNKQ